MKTIWWEKHRPALLRNFVGQSHLMAEMEDICYNGVAMQHFIFHSPEAGTGKTTLAYILAAQCEYTIMQFNASSKRTRGIEFIEEDLIPLAHSGMGEMVILLDEADQLTLAAQSALKGVIENANCYFILTCNDLSKLSPWLQSRCQVRTFTAHSQDECIQRMQTILDLEGMTLHYDDLLIISNNHRGDLRNCIGALQTLSHMDSENRKVFLRRMNEGFDANKYLRLAFKEQSISDAVKLTGLSPMRSIIRTVFDYAVNSDVPPHKIAKVIECCITSERDLVNGVDETIVRWDFARMLACGL